MMLFESVCDKLYTCFPSFLTNAEETVRFEDVQPFFVGLPDFQMLVPFFEAGVQLRPVLGDGWETVGFVA